MKIALYSALMVIWVSACTHGAPVTAESIEPTATIRPEVWPSQSSPLGRDDGQEAQIRRLLAAMTVEEKVGQIMQVDIAAVTPDQARQYNLGAILNGGNSAPGGDVRGEPQAWLALADAFWAASTDTSGGRTAVPIIWGTDAVHGHNNIVGATVFPHNIGLGAANDPALIAEIGAVTAKEIRVTGLDWTFAPTIAVARDDRWGRTYESYSEDPKIVRAYAEALVKGLQGELGTPAFFDGDHVIATAKHFVGDGGTLEGRDQGNNVSSEAVLRDVHAAGYPAAIQAGVQVVMASFNAYHGRKLHGHRPLLTDVLVGRMGFDGFVIGDWNGHRQVEGCTVESCPEAINAGIDMFMAPTSWQGLYRNTVAQVKSGTISMVRLDQAVARILRVKMRFGSFAAGRPSSRSSAGQWSLLADPNHKEVARRAVRSSLVLLKNNGGVLPITPTATVLVAGDGADDIGKQAGGWTLSWQGTGNTKAHFPHGQSIFEGLRDALAAAGGRAFLSEDGTYDHAPDLAVVVFGERPYAEYQGDIKHSDFKPDEPRKMLKRLQAAGIPTVSVFLSGRPMWVNPEINASDAFVVAWLPGDQGAGVADVLVGKADGTARYDFRGRLSFSWPASAAGRAPNVGDEPYAPLFALGYGLRYGEAAPVGPLSEVSGLSEAELQGQVELIQGGDVGPGMLLVLVDEAGPRVVDAVQTPSPSGALASRSFDDQAQEDTRLFEWTKPANLVVSAGSADYRAQAAAGLALIVRYRVNGPADVPPTQLGVACGPQDCLAMVDITERLQRGEGWQTVAVPLKCFGERGADLSRISAPLIVRSEGPLLLLLSSAAIGTSAGPASCDP